MLTLFSGWLLNKPKRFNAVELAAISLLKVGATVCLYVLNAGIVEIKASDVVLLRVAARKREYETS